MFIKLIVGIVAFFIGIFPKKKNLWLFAPRHFNKRCEGNIRSVFLHVIYNEPSIVPVCIYSFDSELISTPELRSYGSKSYKSLKSFLALLRAEVVFLDQGCGGLFLKHKNVVQLWHGTGLKNIGNLDRNNLVKVQSGNWILVVASSKQDRIRKIESFGTNNVYVTGSPRNDELLSSDSVEAIKHKLGVANFKSVFCYVPTFRDNKFITPFSGDFFKKLQIYLAETNSVFLIKKHPRDFNIRIPSEFVNIIDITSKVSNIQELLLVSDVVVSDYSGVVSDYALLKRPIIFYTYDFDEYLKNNRDFYYDLKNTLPGPFVNNEMQLLGLLKDTSWFFSDQHQDRFMGFLSEFQEFYDGNSSERVVNKVKEIVYG